MPRLLLAALLSVAASSAALALDPPPGPVKAAPWSAPAKTVAVSTAAAKRAGEDQEAAADALLTAVDNAMEAGRYDEAARLLERLRDEFGSIRNDSVPWGDVSLAAYARERLRSVECFQKRPFPTGIVSPQQLRDIVLGTFGMKSIAGVTGIMPCELEVCVWGALTDICWPMPNPTAAKALLDMRGRLNWAAPRLEEEGKGRATLSIPVSGGGKTDYLFTFVLRKPGWVWEQFRVADEDGESRARLMDLGSMLDPYQDRGPL